MEKKGVEACRQISWRNANDKAMPHGIRLTPAYRGKSQPYLNTNQKRLTIGDCHV